MSSSLFSAVNGTVVIMSFHFEVGGSEEKKRKDQDRDLSFLTRVCYTFWVLQIFNQSQLCMFLELKDLFIVRLLTILLSL